MMVSGSSCDPDSSHLHLRLTRTDSDEMKSKLLPTRGRPSVDLSGSGGMIFCPIGPKSNRAVSISVRRICTRPPRSLTKLRLERAAKIVEI